MEAVPEEIAQKISSDLVKAFEIWHFRLGEKSAGARYILVLDDIPRTSKCGVNGDSWANATER